MTKKLLFLVAVIGMVAFGAYNASASMWLIRGNTLKWRTGMNASADTGYVEDAGSDTTVWQKMWDNPDELLGTVPNRKAVIPDSIWVGFKATDVASGADDSVAVTVTIQTSDDQSTVSTKRTITTIAEINLDTSWLGFGWAPRYYLDTGTPMGTYYRYIITGGIAGSDDSTKITDAVERRISFNQ